jgi:FAD/FMN-containing dehydrogenase
LNPAPVKTPAASPAQSGLMTRRQFLGRAARFTVGTGLGLSLLSTAGCGSNSSAQSAPPWNALARKLSGPLLRPGDPGFATIAQPNNLRYAKVLPGGIARCQSAEDVAQSILWSRRFDVPLTARSGGHSYAGYSTTTGLMIDLSLMNQLQFDSSTGVVTMGGGARNGDIYSALPPLNVAITHGRCPTVGVAGFVLGGGIGFNMRAHGLGSDQLVVSEIVTAKGDILTLDENHNDALFWACRGGGGGNFGINTSFSFQTFPVSNLTVFKLSWTSSTEDVYAALLAALGAGPPELGTRLAVNAVTPEQFAAGQDVTIALLGQLVGSPADLANILAPVYNVSPPTTSDIEELSYWSAQTGFLAEPGTPGYYQERSRFFIDPIAADAIATIFKFTRQWPGTSAGAHFVLFQTGDQVNAMAPDATAFVHRSSDWLTTLNLGWGTTDDAATVHRNRAWQNEFFDAMRAFSLPESYQNFSDPSLIDWQQAYYGSNLARLRQVKAEFDPHRVFHFHQGISPA